MKEKESLFRGYIRVMRQSWFVVTGKRGGHGDTRTRKTWVQQQRYLLSMMRPRQLQVAQTLKEEKKKARSPSIRHAFLFFHYSGGWGL